jgi:hypothetical protein
LTLTSADRHKGQTRPFDAEVQPIGQRDFFLRSQLGANTGQRLRPNSRQEPSNTSKKTLIFR